MKKTLKERIQNKQRWLASALFALPVPCFANGGGVTMTSIIQNIIDYLTGDLARLVGGLTLIGAGYMFVILNKMEKTTFINICIGMGLILGGPTLADMWWG